MDCRNFEELSQLYIDRELDDERISQFEAHLLACNGCKLKMEYLQATLRGIESYPQLEPPSDLADNVMARIEGSASSWDFSQELVYITSVSRQLASGQLTRFPQSVRHNDCWFNFITAQNLPSRFCNRIPANPHRASEMESFLENPNTAFD